MAELMQAGNKKTLYEKGFVYLNQFLHSQCTHQLFSFPAAVQEMQDQLGAVPNIAAVVFRTWFAVPS